MSCFHMDGRVKRVVITVFLALCATSAWSQQLTTVAIFDLDQVTLSFYQDSAAVREYRQAEEEFRTDLLRAEQTLNEYQTRRANALDRDDTRTAQRLREDIEALQEDIVAIRERWYAQQQEMLETLGEEEFYNNLYETVEYVAEDNGYTVVLESTQLGSSLFWYSQEVDITEEVIQELLARFR